MKNKLGKIAILVVLFLLSCTAAAALSGCQLFASAPPADTAAQASTASAASSSAPIGSLSPTGGASVASSGETGASPAGSATSEPTLSPTEAPSPTGTPEPSPTPTPTPVPTQTPSPTPTENHTGDRPDVTVVKYYGHTSPDWLPQGLGVTLKYDKYWTGVAPLNFLDYFVFQKAGIVRELPDAGSKALQSLKATGRLPLLAEVKGTDGKSQWFRVLLGASTVGYVPNNVGWPDAFLVDRAFAEVKKLKAVADQPNTTRIVNYNNAHGLPPAQPGGKSIDSFGNIRDQTAPAYLTPDLTSSFRYAPDGMLCQVFGAKGDFSEVYFPGWDEVRYVPTKYLLKGDPISTLTQAMVVNRNHHGQNIIVFELIDGQWNIVSMCFVSTGANAKTEKPTPLGDYFTEQHHGGAGIGEFYFINGVPETDANGHPKVDGYAPWAIRFTGGAYLHGMPMGVSYDPVTNKINRSTRTAEVYGNFIGVYPASHMCVRNYTSHAYFMWHWVKDGQASVIVIE